MELRAQQFHFHFSDLPFLNSPCFNHGLQVIHEYVNKSILNQSERFNGCCVILELSRKGSNHHWMCISIQICCNSGLSCSLAIDCNQKFHLVASGASHPVLICPLSNFSRPPSLSGRSFFDRAARRRPAWAEGRRRQGPAYASLSASRAAARCASVISPRTDAKAAVRTAMSSVKPKNSRKSGTMSNGRMK